MNASLHFFVKKNPRLDFKDSWKTIYAFIEKRLSAYGTVIFFDNTEDLTLPSNGFSVFSDCMNPLMDQIALLEAVSFMQKNAISELQPTGLIPGTQFDKIVCPVNGDSAKQFYDFDQQKKHNNQFNIYKYKRLKVFLGLIAFNPDIVNMDIPTFIKFLEDDSAFRKVLSYFEDCRMVDYENCPHCGGEHKPLLNEMSQPFLGFVPSTRSFYYECRICHLVYLSPQIAQEDIYKIYDEFDKEDFRKSLNNPYYAGTPRCDYTFIENALPARIKHLDLGGGIGFYSLFAKSYFKDAFITHADFQIKRNIDLEQQGIKTRAINFLEEPIGHNEYNFITMWEVLEHVTYEKLEFVLSNIHDALEDNGLFLFSTPDYDSPLCKAFDFYSACPPFHPLCFSETWLDNYFSQKSEWKVIAKKPCSDFLDDIDMWMQYAEKTSPGAPLKGLATVIKETFHSNKTTLIQSLLNKGVGTEIIYSLQKVVKNDPH